MRRPLAGKRIVVTRPAHQAASLNDRLEIEGAHPIALPTVAIEPIEPNVPLDEAIERLNEFDWIVFTSANGVDIFFERVKGQRVDLQLGPVRVAAIGPITAKALETHGAHTDVVPKRFVAEEIVAELGDVRNLRILLPRAERARRMLAEMLRDRGARVTEVPTYRTTVPAADPTTLARIADGVDAVTFTSSSTVENFVMLLAEESDRLLERAIVACIGPITAETARSLGLRVDIVADRYTTEGLVEALVKYFENGRVKQEWN